MFTCKYRRLYSREPASQNTRLHASEFTCIPCEHNVHLRVIHPRAESRYALASGTATDADGPPLQPPAEAEEEEAEPPPAPYFVNGWCYTGPVKPRKIGPPVPFTHPPSLLDMLGRGPPPPGTDSSALALSAESEKVRGARTGEQG